MPHRYFGIAATACFCAAQVVAALPSSTAAPTVTRTTLSFAEPFAEDSTATVVNAKGTVLGQGEVYGIGPSGKYLLPYPETVQRAIVWNGAVPTDVNPGLSWISQPTALGDDGTIVGWCFDGGYVKPFVRLNGTTTELDKSMTASAVASNGQVLVEYDDANGSPAVGEWKGGVITRLGPIDGIPDNNASIYWGSDYQTEAFSLNASGVAVGTEAGLARAWAGGAMVTLPLAPGASDSWAGHIDDAGRILGSSGGHGVIWQGAVQNGVWSGAMTVLQALPGGSSSGVDWINASGVAVGWASDAAGVKHPVRWASPTAVPTALSSGAGEATRINATGEIIGTDPSGPAVWLGSATVHPLAGTTLTSGALNDLNDAGKIVGWAAPAGGASHAYAWTVTA